MENYELCLLSSLNIKTLQSKIRAINLFCLKMSPVNFKYYLNTAAVLSYTIAPFTKT